MKEASFIDMHFVNKVSIFTIARTAEYERGLCGHEISMLQDVYYSCNEQEREELELEAYMVVEKIKEFDYPNK